MRWEKSARTESHAHEALGNCAASAFSFERREKTSRLNSSSFVCCCAHRSCYAIFRIVSVCLFYFCVYKASLSLSIILTSIRQHALAPILFIKLHKEDSLNSSYCPEYQVDKIVNCNQQKYESSFIGKYQVCEKTIGFLPDSKKLQWLKINVWKYKKQQVN